MGDEITIEVLLASYNGEKYISRQLDSILDQNVPGLRILVSDDGSTDGTVEILREYEANNPGRVKLLGADSGRFVQHGCAPDTPSGDIPAPAKNFFRLLAHADADYILLSDQDDVWLPGKTERLLAQIRVIEGAGGVPALAFSDMEVVDAGLNRIAPSFFSYAHSNPERLTLAELLTENPVTGGALMMNRALLELVRKMPRACFMHDWWLALCAACFGRIGCVREALSLYRQHGSNAIGARPSGSLPEMAGRPGRQTQVAENYRRMFAQAAAFLEMYGDRLTGEQRQTLAAWIGLPLQTPVGRLRTIRKYHFYKSSLLQTLAMCVTVPRRAAPVPAGRTESRRKSGKSGTCTACVILNYNDSGTAARLAERIAGYGSLDYIVLVDNASTDGSYERLKELSGGKITVIRAEKNGGYGAGNNLGVRYAAEQLGAAYAVIANPDVMFTDSCICHLRRIFERHPDVGVAAAVMINGTVEGTLLPDGEINCSAGEAAAAGEKPARETAGPAGCGPHKGNTAMNIVLKNAWRLHGFTGELLYMGPLSRRLFRDRLYYPASHYRDRTAAYVDVVHGSMLMVDTEAFLACGGYDEGIFLYQEETVLGRRIKADGRRTVLLLTDHYIHEDSVSVSKSVSDALRRQRLRETSVLYDMEHYLGIGPVRKGIAKLWFAVVRAETRIFLRITGSGGETDAG